MTRKDYMTIAAILRGELVIAIHRPNYEGSIAVNTVRDIMAAFANRAADENPRFNREVFCDACGFTPNGHKVAL